MNFDLFSAIIGAIPSAFITWFASWRLNRSNEYNKACARFRSAFVDTINELNSIEKDSFLNSEIINIIMAGFVEQEKAILLFEPYISKTIV